MIIIYQNKASTCDIVNLYDIGQKLHHET